MAYTLEQIKKHRKAAQTLESILRQTLAYLVAGIGKITEYDASQFISGQFIKYNLVSDHHPQIIAFGQNTSEIHYFAESIGSKVLENNSVIMIDLWARLNQPDSPFADITWMAYCGKNVPDNIRHKFNIVIEARDKALELIRSNLSDSKMPAGKEIDDNVRSIFTTHKVVKNFLHTTGHSIGFDSPHGDLSGLSQRNEDRLQKNVLYTLEPGIYFPGTFGIRSEIDFYVDDSNELIITTPVQKEIELLNY